MENKKLLKIIQTDECSMIVNNKEKWSLAAYTHVINAPNQLLESANLNVLFKDGGWSGTIQDFMAIKTYADNALKAFEYYEEIANEDERNCYLDEIAELRQLLSHFK